MSGYLDHDYEFLFKVSPGDVVVDVGAGPCGEFTQSVLDRASIVVAIEPYSKNLRRLHELFGCDPKVVIVGKAVWFRSGDGLLNFEPKGWDGGCSMVCPLSEKERVKVDTLDNLVGELDLKRIDFLKMDVEGAELEALECANRTLAMTRHVVVAAYHLRDGRNTCDWVEKLLGACGFRTIVHETPPGMPLVYGTREAVEVGARKQNLKITADNG